MCDFVSVCRVADIPRGGALHVDVEGLPIALVRVGDEVFAIHDVCSHADVRLSEGDVIDCTIECWLHGSQFDLRTGAALSLPAITPVSVYDVRVDGSGDDATVLVRPKATESTEGIPSE